MAQLTPLTLEDGTVIYIEATDQSGSTPGIPSNPPSPTGEPQRGLTLPLPEPAKVMGSSFQIMENTIRAYTGYTLRAFKNLAIAEVSEVTLKFGMNVDVNTGVPYIANGKAGCSTEITVKCVFPSSQSK